MTNTEAAWLAGIVDGEGCISIRYKPPDKGYPSAQHTLRLYIGMTHQPTINRIQGLCGGRVHLDKRTPPRKPLWHWKVHASDAQKILVQVLPYLFTKRKQAELGLQFAARDKITEFVPGRGKLPVTKEMLEFRDWCYQQMRDLKKEVV